MLAIRFFVSFLLLLLLLVLVLLQAEWAMLIGALHPGYSQGRSWLMWCVLDSKERGYVCTLAPGLRF